MALVLGTNCGFVTTAPVNDPQGAGVTLIDSKAVVTFDSSPATAIKITEIGWYTGNATEAANFEVGLYAADGAVVPGEAGTLLEVSRTNAKGTDAGWKIVTGLNWTISSSTSYWLGVQLDDTTTSTRIDYEEIGGNFDTLTSQTTLPDTFGSGIYGGPGYTLSIYAVWEAGPAVVRRLSINQGDTWLDSSGATSVKINVGDVWKNVNDMKINQGDSWKVVTLS